MKILKKKDKESRQTKLSKVKLTHNNKADERENIASGKSRQSSSSDVEVTKQNLHAEEYDYHNPILLQECLQFLINKKNGIYLDGTLGGGGHSSEIFKRLEFGGKLYSFDKDPEALSHCRIKYQSLFLSDNPKWELINNCYSTALSINEIKGKVNGFLLDLGVSSHQLDTANRGISYRFDAPLDMRFGPNGLTAKELLNSLEEPEIERILRLYGEEPFSRVIARRIVERRRALILNKVSDLKEVVENSVPKHLQIKTLSRVFQAIRISVNRELEVLENTLTNLMPLLSLNGRIVVITYHSLEDRITKNIFKELCKDKVEATKAEDLRYSNYIKIAPKFKNLTKNPILPSEEEIQKNPRSRSAKLRVAEKTSEV